MLLTLLLNAYDFLMNLTLIFKFIFDRVFALIGLLLFWPILLVVSIIVKISSPGPIFFTQKRVGLNGRLFIIIKFRTMVVNDGKNTVSAKNDCRITPIGLFLRKWKLDELPELWNVFVGDMSFVGPRPDVPGYADKLQGESRKILDMRPGITGPATLKYIDEEEILTTVDNPQKYNDEVIYPDKVLVNLKYYYKQSVIEDIYIIILTILRKKPNEY